MLLICLLVKVAGNAFSVEVDDHNIVDTVKDEIKKKKPNAIKCDADELELYLAKRNGMWLAYASDDVKWLSEGETNHVQDLIEGKGLPPVETIMDVFHGINDALRVIHVLVKLPTHDAVDARLTPQKTKWADLKKYIVPSAFGSYKGHHGFVATRENIKLTNLTPIVLLNETFTQFDYNCQHLDIGKADFDFVAELCDISSTPSENETEFDRRVRGLLGNYLLKPGSNQILSISTRNGSRTDGSCLCGEYSLLNLEVKLHKGSGSGDATLQNVAYYIKHLPDDIDRQLPCFLVDISGPLLSVFGIVNVGDDFVICEPLVQSFPLVFYMNLRLLNGLARVCKALKRGVGELYRYYPETRKMALHRTRFPYKNITCMDGTITTLEYISVSTRQIFLAKMEEGRQVIVKFATKYGKKVHEFCALQGFAPKSLACEKLPSEWYFIVMEKIDQLQLLTDVVDQHRPKILDDLKTIQKRLCDMKFVHGDLREGNVLWDVRSERVVLINFDWAGKENKGVYPPFMNNAIKCPDGAESGMPLRVEHDEYWFKKLVKRLDV